MKEKKKYFYFSFDLVSLRISCTLKMATHLLEEADRVTKSWIGMCLSQVHSQPSFTSVGFTPM